MIPRLSLHLSDIEKMIPPPRALDDVTGKSVQDHRRHIKELQLEKFNKNLSEFERRWSEGRPIDLFVAFGLCEYDPDTTCKQLENPAFIRTVLEESAVYGFSETPPRVSPTFVADQPKSERRPEERIQVLSQRIADNSVRRRGNKESVMASHGSPEKGEGALKPISPPERQSQHGEVKLTFVKDDVGFPVGQLFRPS
jgi:hypothetical protein